MKTKVKFNYNKVIGLSFDVEDWFTVRNMKDFIKAKNWDQQEIRIHIGLDFILSELSKRNIKATFFILGWIADKYPDLVQKINLLGHEIASHGYSHIPIDLLDPVDFELDLKKSLYAIEKITGKKVKGFRAPSFSITKKTLWAIDILARNGIEYDSSIFSIIHPDYGINNFPSNVSEVGNILEVPLIKGNFFGLKIPVCGGGYFRMLPYSLIKSVLLQTLKNDSFVMYFHPWEFDPNQPRLNIGWLKKKRHYLGLSTNRHKFIKLLDDFEFTTVRDLIDKECSYEKFSCREVKLAESCNE